jgi:formate hydrogenlyase subunit 3/multisubunit Na+/H+ antiporter MnhD subunit
VTPAPVATTDGWLLVAALMLPIAGVLAAFVLGGRHAERVALGVAPIGLGVAVAIATKLVRGGEPIFYRLGAWSPPLGVALRADGVAAAMLVTTAVVIGAAALFARADFGTPRGERETRKAFSFWIFLMALWAALNAAFLGADLFHLFVALELLTFAAVPLVSLDGSAKTLQAALRYLLFALLGSVLYLLGVGLLYGGYGTLDIALLSSRVRPEPLVWVAAALMTAGLLAKTALFPLHLWLPPAHAGAPAAASAVLSALVVKGSFFLIFRIWFDVLPALRAPAAMQVLAALGAAAILFGSVLALRQARLKLLVAYSTVAQVGYLFLMFPLVGATAIGSSAFTGGVLQAVSHALAKAAMFLAAGLVAKALGHDRIADFRGVGRALPMSLFGFALGGLSLMGLPPSGGFVAKWLLLRASIESGQWWWALVIVGGGMFTGGYVFHVVARALAASGETPALRCAIPRHQEVLVLGLALLSVAIGLLPIASLGLVLIGRAS